MFPRFPNSRRWHGATANDDLRIHTVSVKCTPVMVGWRLVATYELSLPGPRGRRQIVFDHSLCPIQIIAIDGGAVEILAPTDGRRAFGIDLEAAGDKRSFVSVTMEWRTSRPEEAWRCRFLVLPRDLPRPTTAIVDRDRIYDTGVTWLDGDDMPTVVAGGCQLDGKRWLPARVSQRQVICVDPAFVAYQSDDVVLAGDRAIMADRGRLDAIATGVGVSRRFIARQLGVDIVGRLVIVADDNGETLPAGHGAIIVGSGDAVGLGDRDTPLSLALNGMLSISKVWWGAGVRVPGDAGWAVTTGIANALSLRGAQMIGGDACLRRNRDVLERTIADLTRSGRAPLFLFGVRLALALHDRLEHQTVLKGLRSMTRQYWGRTVSADEVMGRLASLGIAVAPMSAQPTAVAV